MTGLAGCYLGERARRIKLALECSSSERTPKRKENVQGSLWKCILTLLRKAYYYAISPMASGNEPRFAHVHLALLLVLIGFGFIFLDGKNTVWAAEAHVAHSSVATLQHSASTSALKGVSNNDTGLDNPILINGQWYCPRADEEAQAQIKVVGGAPQYSEACIRAGFIFPCSDQLNLRNGSMQPSEGIINKDWLVGDVPIATEGGTYVAFGGHLVYTWSSETYAAPQIIKLFGYMEAIAFFLLVPSTILVGYQIMVGASTFRYANALEGLSRVALGGLAIAASYGLVQTFVSLETVVQAGVLLLHMQHPFPRISVNGVPVPYALTGTIPREPTLSYRGIVMPISRWGCTLNSLLGIFSVPFVANTLGSIIPLLGNFTHLAGSVLAVADVIQRIGAVVLMALSAVLTVQAFVRIFLLNYYILTGPLAFGCWALPGKVGQRVLRLWCKGFFSVLFVQVLQLFIITTLPLLLPTLPQISADNIGLIQSFLLEFPPILTLSVALMAPRLLGASATKAFGTAGSMAGGVMAAVGSATFQVG